MSKKNNSKKVKLVKFNHVSKLPDCRMSPPAELEAKQTKEKKKDDTLYILHEKVNI